MARKKLSSVLKAAKATETRRKPEPTQGGSRAGKKPVIAYLDPAVMKQLKVLCAEQEMTQQDAVVEALNDLFIKNGKPGIG